MFSVIAGFLGNLVSPVATAITRNKELNVAQHEADLKAVQAAGDRQAELIRQGKADDAAWEQQSLKAGQQYRGVELYVVMIPTVLCFCGPRGAQIVKDGFAALQSCPLWFQTLLLMIFCANYGIRCWRQNQSDT